MAIRPRRLWKSLLCVRRWSVRWGDARGKQRDLHLARAGVGLVLAVVLDDGRFLDLLGH
jgi:hypothetical protein